MKKNLMVSFGLPKMNGLKISLRIFFVLFLYLFILQVVSAIDTEIQIKTPSFTEIHLTILDPSTILFSALAGPYKITSDYYGDITFNHSGDESVFDLMVVLKKAGETISSEKYRNKYRAGQQIYLEIIPEGYELVETPGISNTTNATLINSTGELNELENLNETNSTLEQEFINKSGISGFSVFTGQRSSPLKILSYIGVFILLFGMAFFVLKFMRSKKTHNIKITKLSEMKSSRSDKEENSDEESNFNKLIKEAEAKLKEAQDEMNGLKKEQKIKEIEERMIRDKKELKDLSR